MAPGPVQASGTIQPGGGGVRGDTGPGAGQCPRDTFIVTKQFYTFVTRHVTT